MKLWDGEEDEDEDEEEDEEEEQAEKTEGQRRQLWRQKREM